MWKVSSSAWFIVGECGPEGLSPRLAAVRSRPYRSAWAAELFKRGDFLIWGSRLANPLLWTHHGWTIGFLTLARSSWRWLCRPRAGRTAAGPSGTPVLPQRRAVTGWMWQRRATSPCKRNIQLVSLHDVLRSFSQSRPWAAELLERNIARFAGGADASDKQGNDKLDWTRVARASSVDSADQITSRIRIQRRAEPIELARSLTGLEAWSDWTRMDRTRLTDMADRTTNWIRMYQRASDCITRADACWPARLPPLPPAPTRGRGWPGRPPRA